MLFAATDFCNKICHKQTSAVGGTVRLSILGVRWLMTSSRVVGCDTAGSAGFEP